MTAKKYILSQLESLKTNTFSDFSIVKENELAETIFKLLMSKKFRKYSVPEKNQEIIRKAIYKNIQNGEPIKISWPFGGYKLWRFEESPEADWAELFSMIYFTKWLLPVCKIYKKGVEFTFWSDEIVISMMNNIPQEDLDRYKESFLDLLDFMKTWIPDNLKFNLFLERSQYKNQETFNGELASEMDKLSNERAASGFTLSESAIRSIEMNVKTTPEQTKDPLWREKVDLMHYAYYNLQEQQNTSRQTYSKENITAFTIFFEPNVIPIGSTKTSIVRFWVGVGALRKKEDGFIEEILSISQLENSVYSWEDIQIDGLVGKNFSKIRII